MSSLLKKRLCFNPSFSMEWSGSEPGNNGFQQTRLVSILVFQWNGLEEFTVNIEDKDVFEFQS